MVLMVFIGSYAEAMQIEGNTPVREIVAYQLDNDGTNSHIIARYNPLDSTYSVQIIASDPSISRMIVGEDARKIYEILSEYDVDEPEDEWEVDTQEDSDSEVDDQKGPENKWLQVDSIL